MRLKRSSLVAIPSFSRYPFRRSPSKTFLGLTVSCARCHDHKFDAISQADYYALFGIFASTRPGRVAIASKANFTPTPCGEPEPVVRQRQANSFCRPRAGAPAQRVLVGDFNATPVWPVYRRIASVLSDAALMVARRRGERPRNTWGPWAGSPRLLRIDHAMVEGVGVEDLQVVHVPGSDHSAVVVDVTSGGAEAVDAAEARR